MEYEFGIEDGTEVIELRDLMVGKCCRPGGRYGMINLKGAQGREKKIPNNSA